MAGIDGFDRPGFPPRDGRGHLLLLRPLDESGCGPDPIPRRPADRRLVGCRRAPHPDRASADRRAPATRRHARSSARPDLPGHALPRRDPVTRRWSERKIDETPATDVNFLHGAITQLPGDPSRLWVLAAYSTQLRLYTSADRGETWQRVELPDFRPFKLTAASYLYLIHPSSGSVMPEGLCANFSEGVTPHRDYSGHYRLWMARVFVPGAARAGRPR